MKAKKVAAVLLASAMAVSASTAVYAADSSVSSVAESIAEEVAEADQTPVTAEEMTAENYADFITLSDYKNLAVGFADGEQVAEGDTVVIDFVGKVAPEVAAALAAAYETEAET
ncbi:MAG: hypothetical protein Q4B09_10170, partial [Lachnospiraceae bacterium]|nr:hypothetical protein [Lachnospiraceae bacterium]